jgi:hypothetical protein
MFIKASSSFEDCGIFYSIGSELWHYAVAIAVVVAGSVVFPVMQIGAQGLLNGLHPISIYAPEK